MNTKLEELKAAWEAAWAAWGNADAAACAAWAAYHAELKKQENSDDH